MHLVIFDLDGTLLASNHLEAGCFIQTMAECFNITDIPRDWRYYAHVTDLGIARQLLFEQMNHILSADDAINIEANFIKRLMVYLREIEILPVAGSLNFFNQLLENSNYHVAIATGSFLKSALLKLKKANFNIANVPIATCNDHYDRKIILNTAIERARREYPIDGFNKITYIGDGIWDYHAATALQLNFIGIDTDSLGAPLSKMSQGITVLDDFLDVDYCFRLLE